MEAHTVNARVLKGEYDDGVSVLGWTDLFGFDCTGAPLY